jgi:hypothetical protein
MNWESIRIEAGFFAFYVILGFRFICGPLALIGYVFRISNQNLLITSAILTFGSASLLSILTSGDVKEEVDRQKETNENEFPSIRNADESPKKFSCYRLTRKDYKRFQEEMK